MKNPFDVDPYPGNPKILFIGLGMSTHTHSWIDLLSDARLNVRLFSVPGGGVPPSIWKTPTYISDPSVELPKGLHANNRQSFYPLPEEIDEFEKELQKRNNVLRNRLMYWVFLSMKKGLDAVGWALGMPVLYYDYSHFKDLHGPNSHASISDPERWLAEIIQSWKPDIIHTLGLFDGQGGDFYFKARKRFGLEHMGIWILQLRGGSDIALRRHNPEIKRQLLEIFCDCNQIITDNYSNIEYLKELGFGNKIASISPTPGTGGMDIDKDPQDMVLPSERQRIIFWPKAHESMWSKALPIIEAIKLVWDQIKPCTIYVTAVDGATESWFQTLPEEIRKNCQIQLRVPRQQVLEMMEQARVMLAPSLVDGVPNVLYEAMVNGAFPIVSPLDTIVPIISEPQNTIFARNLYVQEIADAIVKAMADDELIDRAAKNNLELVRKIASRQIISNQVTDYYFHISK